MALNNVDIHTASRRRFVVVVDSNARNLAYTSTLLERFQYNVCTARTAGEAVEIAAVITPVLIVTAQQLDDMPGLDLIRQFKQIETTRGVSVIVLTRKADPVNMRACLAAGAVTCLPTPVSIEDLYRVVQVAIEPVPRMNIRIKTRLPITINNRDVDCGEGACARALSEHGAYVRTREPYPLNTRFPVRIHLDDGAISVDAAVIYTRHTCKGQMDQPGMGLQFVQISNPDQQRIRRFIRDEITKGIDCIAPGQ